jgi:LemA protein
MLHPKNHVKKTNKMSTLTHLFKLSITESTMEDNTTQNSTVYTTPSSQTQDKVTYTPSTNLTPQLPKIGGGLAWVIGIVAVLGLLAMWLAGGYNGLITKKQEVDTKFANLKTQYQRRADLIPNFVETVKAAGVFEQNTLTEVVAARAKATSVTVNVDNPEQLKNYQDAQSQLTAPLGRLLATAEAYPQLKALQGYENLQAELSGTENRIAVARADFNTIVGDFNGQRNRFPTVILANIYGFKEYTRFENDPGTEKAPKLDFNTSSSTASVAPSSQASSK